ncbi:MAG: hypothetical protein NTY19_09090, partial [Planctomycetota bacterium]|nr:hypothetical protein [Planctomycetota bacterium]
MDAQTIIRGVESVTRNWTKQRKAEERGRSRATRREAMEEVSLRMNVKQAAWEAMREAYLKASDDGRLPTPARMVMYAARPEILELTNGRGLDSHYFTQHILPDYVARHPEETADWDIVYDARGHYQEPHTRRITPLGTLGVREYLEGISGHCVPPLQVEDLLARSEFPTCGPRHRFSAVLFIEKEGFQPLLEASNLAQQYDIAIMSTKGMPTVSARHLADELCGGHGIPLLVLRDFDKSGFSMLGTLKGVAHFDENYNERPNRYEYMHEFEVVDLGLRLDDIN